MSRNRLRNARLRITVPIVLGPMAHENAAGGLYLSNQIAPFHDTTNSSTLRIPDTASKLRSR